MSHESSQPTLNDRHEGSLADRIAALGLVDLVTLSAFEASRDDPAPISPTLRLTFELAGRLRRANVLCLLEELPRSIAWGQARAIYDPIAWAYLADPLELGAMDLLVSTTIRRRLAEGPSADALWLWLRLVDAELESYLTHLLRRQLMDPAWARSLVDQAGADLDELNLAQRRAIAWAAVKESTEKFTRTSGDLKQCFNTIVSEIRRQARWIRRNQPQASGSLPSSSWRQPLVLRTFLSTFSLAHRYWTEVPSIAAVKDTR